MVTWTLILTLLSQWHGTTAVTATGGFESSAACQAAGNAWAAQVADQLHKIATRPSMLCVPSR